ncbi:NADH-quinone oxidoreductase subunit C [Thermostilla marina]
METAALIAQMQADFPEEILAVDTEAIDPWVEVRAKALPYVARRLRDDDRYAFNFLHCISAVDYCEPDPKKAAKVEWEPHLEVLYHLSSMKHRHRIVLKVVLPRWKDNTPGRLPEVPSLSGIWPTAEWHEREVYDLSGVYFTNHPDLRRILCPEDWVGHPLRKDYQMPEEYHGIRAR